MSDVGSSLAAPDLSADRQAAPALTPVTPIVLARLETLVAMLFEWQARMNLVAPSTLPQVWTRHVADSLQLLRLAPEARVWVDLGAGAGFPGLALACALADAPGTEVHLVESIGKKVAFLRAVIEALKLPAVVHHERIEDFVRHGRVAPHIVTARALASLDKLLGYAAPLLKRGALGLFLKGQDVEAELTEASKYWTIQASLAPSVTNPGGRIVVVRSAVRTR